MARVGFMMWLEDVESTGHVLQSLQCMGYLCSER